MLHKILNMYSRRTTVIISTVVAALIVYNLSLLFSTTPAEVTDEVITKVVTTAPIGSLASTDGRSFVGTIRAVNQAEIHAEAAGRVVSVSAKVGDVVRAGQTLAQLENSAQRAAVTQAQGAYEAALATTQQGTQQSDSALRNAEINLTATKNQAVTAVRSAYNSSNSALITVIDQFYANPLGLHPTLRISGTDTTFMRTERVALQTVMADWRTELQTISVSGDVDFYVLTAEQRTQRILGLIDELIAATTRANADVLLQDQPLASFTPTLIAERASLNAVVQTLKNTQTSLVAAEEAIVQAQIGDTTTTVSLTDAQLKQSLGVLQAAQANLAKTIIRSPISGKLNKLTISVGEFVGGTAPVAEVVNDSAYEITIYVTETERAELAIGDTVLVNNNLSGTVSSIAPAFDSATQKIAVKIALESTTVVSGATATVALDRTIRNQSTHFNVPLTAIAFSLADGAVLTVEDGVVTPIPVVLGQIRGNYIEITGDITAETHIITDARGIIIGESVTIQ